jgi:hypothetical protein
MDGTLLSNVHALTSIRQSPRKQNQMPIVRREPPDSETEPDQSDRDVGRDVGSGSVNQSSVDPIEYLREVQLLIPSERRPLTMADMTTIVPKT